MRKWLILFLSVVNGVYGQDVPEGPSGFQPKMEVVGHECMVTSANPLATQAGFETLLKGGNAIDAAIAVQLVLNVVEPQSSGIGGGAFLLYYDHAADTVKAYDGRETAPLGVHEKWFLGLDNRPISRSEAMVGGRSVGVPGVLKMLEKIHQEHGVLPWKVLFEHAIKLAEQGFEISPRLHKLSSEASFFPQDRMLAKGDIFKNPELAATFRTLAEEGTDPFYQGSIAQTIVEAVQKQGGVLTLADLADYHVKVREPLVTSLGDYLIYGFPPPSSGGIAISQTLAMIKEFDLTGQTLGSTSFIDLFSRASRMAFADRDYYVADPDFFPVPVDRLLDPSYLSKRAASVIRQEKVGAGHYPGASLSCCPPMIMSSDLELPSTTHISIIDQRGNCVSMTSSIENAFGSKVMAAGFLLNNQLTDFSLIPEKEGKKAANRIEPGKRPMSSMSPTLVFKKTDKKNQLYLTLGSAGGARIIDYVAKALCGVLIFDLNIQEAISFPNYASLDHSIDLEAGTFLTGLASELEKLGNVVRIIPLTSGTQGIQNVDGKLIGGADPRREGEAAGQ